MSFTVFFDTEFTTLDPRFEGYPALISIGCVAQDGREFYAELQDTWQPGNCSQFVLETVVPLLQGGDCRMMEPQCAVRLQKWMEGLSDKQVILRSDAPSFDWPWIEQLFQFYGCWPKNLRRKCGTVYFEDQKQHHRYLAGMEFYWKDNIARQHHALVDARSLHFAWKYASKRTM